MNFEKSVLIYHVVIMILMVALGYMFLSRFPNPLNIDKPFNYILGAALVIYGFFRGWRAWNQYRQKA